MKLHWLNTNKQTKKPQKSKQTKGGQNLLIVLILEIGQPIIFQLEKCEPRHNSEDELLKVI